MRSEEEIIKEIQQRNHKIILNTDKDILALHCAWVNALLWVLGGNNENTNN